MDAKSLAKLIIRLIAFYTLWSSITQLPMLTMAVEATSDDYSTSTAFIILLMVLGPVLLAMALWKYSDPIAILIVGTPPLESSEPQQTPTMHAIAISTAGLAMLLWTVPKLLSIVLYIFSLNEKNIGSMDGFRGLMVPALQCLFALSMVFGAGLWAALIRRFKTFGLQNK